MSLVRLIGFTSLECGCIVAKYCDLTTSREVTYVEEKGQNCLSHEHQRNHTVTADRPAAVAPFALATKAS